jgi:hypothetical protein
MSAENLPVADGQVTQEVTTLVRRYFELQPLTKVQDHPRRAEKIETKVEDIAKKVGNLFVGQSSSQHIPGR